MAAEAAFLREIDALSERLFGDLDLRARLDTACAFWVPSRAEWILITLVDPSTQVAKIAALWHRERVRGELLFDQMKDQPYYPHDRTFWAEATAEIAIPMQVDGILLGTIHLGIAPGRQLLHQTFDEQIAARCGLAIRNAQLFEEQRKISLAFQSAALATELPQIKGLRFDAVYEAAQADALVGGDWYDAFLVADGRIVLSIGDVTGSGLSAAVAMTNVRQAIRGVAQVHPDPAVMLSAAERTLRLQHKDLLVTAFVAVLDPVTQELSYSSAGHPPPLLRTSDASVHALRTGRPPLGLSEFDAEFSVYHVEMPPGCLLLLYTDGLIESTKNILEGEARLRKALETPDIGVYDNVARKIHEMVLGQRSRDDVAILSVRVENAREVWRWRLDPMWADAAARVRSELCALLPARTFGTSYRTDCEVIFSELMSNIMRYAPGTAEVILEQQGDEFVLHVLDKGPGLLFVPRLPPDLFSEFGRGLFLIANLARDFSVSRRPGGGSHARVVLLQGNGA